MEHTINPENVLIPFRKGLKWGFCNADKTMVIECKYEDARPFYFGLAEVQTDRWNYIDETGRELFSEGLLANYPATEGFGLFLRTDRTCGFINAHGEIIADGYEDGKPFSEGLAAVQKGGKWGFIDRAGKEAIPCRFEEVKPFSEGMALIYEKSIYGYINTSGQVVVPCTYCNARDFKGGLACVQDKKYGPYGYIDKTGKTIIPLEYDDAESFSEGLAAVEEDDCCGYIDVTGKVVIPFKYAKAYPFSGGMAFVQKGDIWQPGCFINQQGKAVSRKRRFCGSFKEGLSRTMADDGKWGFINTRDEEIVPFQYEGTGSFLNGLCYVSFHDKKKPYSGYIDTEGTQYWEQVYEKKAKAKKADTTVVLDSANFEQYTKAIDIKKAMKKYNIASQLEAFEPCDFAEVQQTLLYKGDLHVKSLKMLDDTYNMIIDGNLTVDEDLKCSGDVSGCFLLVTGNVQAKNVYISYVCTLAIRGNLTAGNGIIGIRGDDGGALDVNGEVRAPFIIADTYFCMSLDKTPDAIAIIDRSSQIFIKSKQEPLTGVDPAKVLRPEMIKNTLVDTDAIIEAMKKSQKVLL